MNNKNFIIVTIILAIVAGIGLASYLPTGLEQSMHAKMADFPKKIGDWSATDIPLREIGYKSLGTRNVLMRNYKNSQGDAIVLYIVYSGENRQVSYPPEVSYLGSGKTIVKKSVELLTPSIKVNKILLEQGNIRQMLVYWFRAQGLNTENYIEQQIKIAIRHLLLKPASGAIIRLSIDIKNNSEKSAFKTIQQFTTLIEPLLPVYLP